MEIARAEFCDDRIWVRLQVECSATDDVRDNRRAEGFPGISMSSEGIFVIEFVWRLCHDGCRNRKAEKQRTFHVSAVDPSMSPVLNRRVARGGVTGRRNPRPDCGSALEFSMPPGIGALHMRRRKHRFQDPLSQLQHVAWEDEGRGVLAPRAVCDMSLSRGRLPFIDVCASAKPDCAEGDLCLRSFARRPR